MTAVTRMLVVTASVAGSLWLVVAPHPPGAVSPEHIMFSKLNKGTGDRGWPPTPTPLILCSVHVHIELDQIQHNTLIQASVPV